MGQPYKACEGPATTRAHLRLLGTIVGEVMLCDDCAAEVERRHETRRIFAEELAPSAAGSPVGTVGVIDESAFTKKGAHSAGVARQHNGRLGKEDNCQVGVDPTVVS